MPHRQVQCDICSKSMRSDHLKRHMRVHEKDPYHIPTLASTPASTIDQAPLVKDKPATKPTKPAPASVSVPAPDITSTKGEFIGPQESLEIAKLVRKLQEEHATKIEIENAMLELRANIAKNGINLNRALSTQNDFEEAMQRRMGSSDSEADSEENLTSNEEASMKNEEASAPIKRIRIEETPKTNIPTMVPRLIFPNKRINRINFGRNNSATILW